MTPLERELAIIVLNGDQLRDDLTVLLSVDEVAEIAATLGLDIEAHVGFWEYNTRKWERETVA